MVVEGTSLIVSASSLHFGTFKTQKIMMRGKHLCLECGYVNHDFFV